MNNLMKYPVLRTRNNQKRVIRKEHCQLTGSQVNHSLIITQRPTHLKKKISID